MDTAKIVPKLEEIYPEPSLYLDSTTNDEADKLVQGILMSFVRGLIPEIKVLLQEPSKSYYVESRERRSGMTMSEMTKEFGGERGWQKADPFLQMLKALFESNKRDNGPFILGSKPSFGDFIIVALFESFKKLAQGVYDRLLEYDTSFQDLNEACRPWTERDD